MKRAKRLTQASEGRLELGDQARVLVEDVDERLEDGVEGEDEALKELLDGGEEASGGSAGGGAGDGVEGGSKESVEESRGRSGRGEGRSEGGCKVNRQEHVPSRRRHLLLTCGTENEADDGGGTHAEDEGETGKVGSEATRECEEGIQEREGLDEEVLASQRGTFV